MAKVIENDTELQLISTSYPVLKIALVGVLSGLFFWLLTMLIERYVIDSLFCHSVSGVLTCSKSTNISGNIATILVAIWGIVTMVRLRIAQPLIIAAAVGAALWGLAQWTDGLPVGEIIVWSMFTYALAYIVFSWITRYARVLPTLAIMTIIIIAERIFINL